jgi:hypothetical protein
MNNLNNSTPSQVPGKKNTSLAEHASNAWSGFTNLFKTSNSNSSSADPSANNIANYGANHIANPTTGGKRRKRKSMKGGNPKKGMKSRTRKGRKDFVTHKGDKYYNRKGKHHSRSRSGRKGRPYSRRSRK